MDLSRIRELGIRREDLIAEKCRRSLYEFVKTFWEIGSEGIEFQPGWHFEVLCEHLEAVTRGQIKKLLINSVYRHGKSSIVGVYWPAWEWIQDPATCNGMGACTRWFMFSYTSTLVERDAMLHRNIVESDLYKLLFDRQFLAREGKPLRLSEEQNTKRIFKNNFGGQRISSSIEGMATGEGGDRIVVDDPHHAQDVHFPGARQAVIDWWVRVMTTRANSPNTSRVVAAQRLHPKDLSGYILANEKGWEHVNLGIRHNPQRVTVTCLGPTDRRTEPGELLWSNRYMNHPTDGAKQVLIEPTQEEIMQARITSGAVPQPKIIWQGEVFRYGDDWELEQRTALRENAPAQMDQDPQAGGFRLMDEEHFPLYDVVPQGDLFVFWSWDMSFKNAPTADFCAGVKIGYLRPMRRYYVMDRVMGQWEYKEAKAMIQKCHLVTPGCSAVVIEESANGYAIMSDLGGSGIPLVSYSVGNTSKVSRQRTFSTTAAERRVFMPSWVDWVYGSAPGKPQGLVTELCGLPNTAHDDQSDALIQGVLWNELEEFKANQVMAVPVVFGRLGGKTNWF